MFSLTKIWNIFKPFFRFLLNYKSMLQKCVGNITGQKKIRWKIKARSWQVRIYRQMCETNRKRTYTHCLPLSQQKSTHTLSLSLSRTHTHCVPLYQPINQVSHYHPGKIGWKREQETNCIIVLHFKTLCRCRAQTHRHTDTHTRTHIHTHTHTHVVHAHTQRCTRKRTQRSTRNTHLRPDNTAIQKLLPNESICRPPPLCAGPTNKLCF